VFAISAVRGWWSMSLADQKAAVAVASGEIPPQRSTASDRQLGIGSA